jgi:hypothetical protein
LFVSDRGANIKKALEGHEVLFCFGHRINNILQRAFYQIKLKQDQQLQATTTTTNVRKKRRAKSSSSSDGENSSDDDDDRCRKPSPSKQPEATTTFASLPTKPKELLDVISASKSIVKYIKLVSNIFS